MANLIKNDRQVKACAEINEMLTEIAALNKLIRSECGEHFAVVVSRKQHVKIDESLNKKFLSLLLQQRKKRIREIVTKAEKFQIELDSKDEELISDRAIVPRENEGQTQAE